MQPILAREYIRLGRKLTFIMNPQFLDIEGYKEQVRDFLDGLNTCRLHTTLTAANKLTTLQLHYDTYTGKLDIGSTIGLRAMTQAIEANIERESNICTLSLRKSDVSDLLRQLPPQLSLNPDQERLRNETILCLESGAYRAAATMGWNLAYDYVRRWVFQNHLSALNPKLRIDEQIANYEDFYTTGPKEWDFLRACGTAGILGGRIVERLQHFLRERNDYAHANDHAPTANQVNSMVEHLLGIIARPPFN